MVSCEGKNHSATNEGNGKRKNSFQQSANNDREATLEQFFNEIFYFKTKYLTRRHWMRWWRF